MTPLTRRDLFAAAAAAGLSGVATGDRTSRRVVGTGDRTSRRVVGTGGDTGRRAVGEGPGRSWTMYQSDARNTGFAYGQMAPGSGLGVAERFEVDGAVAGQPVVSAGGIVVQRRDGTVRTFAEDGPAWTAELDGTAGERPRDGPGVSPVGATDAVYVGSADGTLYALDSETGERRWRFDADGPSVASPLGILRDDGRVVCWTVADRAEGGSAYALDAGTGEPLWRTAVADLRVDRSPAAYGGRLFVPGTGALHALDVATGDVEWRFEVDGELTSSPAAIDGSVYVGAGGSAADAASVYALSETGDLRWTFDGAGAVHASPSGYEELVYVGSRDGTLYALDGATGESRWQVDVGSPVETPPVLTGTTVYVATRAGELFAVDAEAGDRTGRADLGGERPTAPVITDGVGVGIDERVVWIDDVDDTPTPGSRGNTSASGPQGNTPASESRGSTSASGSRDDTPVPGSRGASGWLDGWWSIGAWVGGLAVVGPLVLGALVVLTEWFGEDAP